ncbi:MAG: cellulase family glycosylhydrolase [Lachnospiraceae bacterium]|nr:cellulase family glycosylhydrolase [Lachnospiraceae bacterium]
MRKIKLFGVLALTAMLSFSACGGSTDGTGDTAVQTGAVDTAGETGAESTPDPMEELKAQMGFYVDGTTLYDANGNPFVMRGINHAHTWFSDKMFLTLDALEETGSNCVRIVLSNGEQWSKTEANVLEGIIKLCKEHKLIAVLEVHDPTGNSDKNSLLAAAQYFVDVKDALIGQEDYVIINIANEWPANSDSKVWKEAYLEAIPMLREAGLAHTIMVDCAGWGQYAKCIEDAGAEVFAADPLGNVMFSVHMYGTAGGSAEKIEQNLKYATDQGLCVCVGEFGFDHSDGDVDEAFLMQYCEENDIGYLAWSWKGNGGDVAYLDMAEKWDGGLTQEWGEVVVNGPNGIKETSKLCTVFDEENMETEQ